MADSDSGSSAVVAIVAIIVIIALGFIALRMFPQTQPDSNGTDINVELPTGGSNASN